MIDPSRIREDATRTAEEDGSARTPLWAGATGGLLGAACRVGPALGVATGTCLTPEAYRSLRSRWLDVAFIAFAATYAFGRIVVTGVLERL